MKWQIYFISCKLEETWQPARWENINKLRRHHQHITWAESSRHWTSPLARSSLFREPQVSCRRRLANALNSAVLSCCRWANSWDPLGSETPLKKSVPSRARWKALIHPGLIFQCITWPAVTTKKKSWPHAQPAQSLLGSHKNASS